MRRTLTTLLGLSLLVSAVALPATAENGTIADIVIAASGGVDAIGSLDDNNMDYDILREAVLADETLTAAVSGTGDFAGVDLTVLAPNDSAFLRLTGASSEADAVQWLVDNGLAPGSAALQDVVLYHVVAGASLSTQDVFFDGYDEVKKVKMANGQNLKVKFLQLKDRNGRLVGPRWRAMDIMADNGMIHTIKDVILPRTNA